MRIIALATVFAVTVMVGWPTGQAYSQSRPGTQPGQAQGQAPVGHRQPRAGDAPQVDAGQPMDAATTQRLDQELDRKLKSICRGC
jgi:hypothetical protein